MDHDAEGAWIMTKIWVGCPNEKDRNTDSVHMVLWFEQACGNMKTYAPRPYTLNRHVEYEDVRHGDSP